MQFHRVEIVMVDLVVLLLSISLTSSVSIRNAPLLLFLLLTLSCDLLGECIYSPNVVLHPHS